MQSRTITFIFSLLILTACQSSPKTLPLEFDSAKIGTTEHNITYCTINGVPLKMDIYYPSTIEQQWPVVLSVHGGSWMVGSKDSIEFIDIEKMRSTGILLVSIDYRLAPQYKFPAMIEDVKCAVRHLRARAKEYNLDPARIGVIGISAGGHLVALLGLADQSAGFDTGEYLEYSSRVNAVVSISGLSDLTPPFTTQLFFDRMDVFGTYEQRDPIFRLASPVKHITPDDPPFLIIHGEFDKTIPVYQSFMLYEQLKEAGISAQYIKVTNADHSYNSVGEDPISPSKAEIINTILLFFKKQLLN